MSEILVFFINIYTKFHQIAKKFMTLLKVGKGIEEMYLKLLLQTKISFCQYP